MRKTCPNCGHPGVYPYQRTNPDISLLVNLKNPRTCEICDRALNPWDHIWDNHESGGKICCGCFAQLSKEEQEMKIDI